MTKRERDVMQYTVEFIRHDYDGRRLSSVTAGKLTKDERKEVREYVVQHLVRSKTVAA